MSTLAEPPQIIPSDLLLLAYRSGIFPMSDRRDDPEVFWVEPRERAILPLDNFRCSRSLAKAVRQDRFRVTLNTAFEDVIAACAAPRPNYPESWISGRIGASYRALHMIGHAHSIECWQGDDLVGGLYGVSFDRVFCGESMFSRASNASKVALAWLVALMRRGGYELLDCQFITDHLASLGAVSLSQRLYLERLRHATTPGPSGDLAGAYSGVVEEAGASSPGKLIAQSLTQTS
ncbi:leucyl/phenylalanyl-tRNA--protein transferase [Altericroceibacterium xinjiangense]|uniref:leucyl/phenylalanyl-tRNA--protein transferase n=1 Tax=Altericroceibacterium xinjiangense TaxID=762261 RepID=UPI0013DFC1E9|nr:leucyl/phenylalanyl-tRNA--protein transferase [Altericroceibacterium xinjiangense]